MKEQLLKCVHYTSLLFIILFSFITIVASGGGDGGDGDSSNTFGGDVNDAGYPDVEGRYSFNTEEISYTCTDGETGTSPAIAFNIEITQTDNTLVASRTTSPDVPGVTVLEANQATGNIEKDGHFIINQNIVVSLEDISGNCRVSYSFTGYFNESGWSGDYEYTILFIDHNVSCTYTTTFTGDYLYPSEVGGMILNNSYHNEDNTELNLEGNVDDLKYLFGNQ